MIQLWHLKNTRYKASHPNILNVSLANDITMNEKQTDSILLTSPASSPDSCALNTNLMPYFLEYKYRYRELGSNANLNLIQTLLTQETDKLPLGVQIA